MNIFKKIKQIFVKPVGMEAGKKNELVVRSSSGGRIKLNKTLSVPDGFVCLLVCKEKVLDRFTSGEHKLSIENIPAVCRTLKLNVPNKKGKYKNSFFADVYFLKLDEILDKKFASQQGIYVKKDRNFLDATVFVSGKYSFELADPVLFLEALLKMYGIIKGSLAQRQLDIWVGELVDKKIEKNKCSLDLLNARDSACFKGLLEYLNKNLADIGVKITKVEVDKTHLPKNIYKKTNLIFDEQFENSNPQNQNFDLNPTDASDKVLTTAQNVKTEQILTNGQNLKNEPSLTNGQNLSQQISNQPFYSEQILNQQISTEPSLINTHPKPSLTNGFDFNSDIKQLETEDFSVLETDKPERSQTFNHTTSFMNPVEPDIPNYSGETASEEMLQQSSGFDDLDYQIPEPSESLEELQTKISYKKCKNCGAINSKQAKVCFECKTSFLKVCQKCGCQIENGDFVCPKCKSIVI